MKKIPICFLFLIVAISGGCVFSATDKSATNVSPASPVTQSSPGQSAAREVESANKVVPATPTVTTTPEKAKSDIENRCGWFLNPTPANAWLIDADGQWTISTQGGESAEGDWPEFPDDQWVRKNGYYGYGCACMKVKTDKRNKRITEIVSGAAKPLSACRNDKKLSEPS